MWVAFEMQHGRCICNECFYGFNCLTSEDFEMYETEGLFLKSGMEVTPELVSLYFKACDKLFRKHYNLEAKPLEELCLKRIQKAKGLDTQLLPPSLRRHCAEYSEEKIPRWFPEWSIPSILVRF